MEYDPDADMLFNYLLVSALAEATDAVDKGGTKLSGGKNKSYPHGTVIAEIDLLGPKLENIYIVSKTLHFSAKAINSSIL